MKLWTVSYFELLPTIFGTIYIVENNLISSIIEYLLDILVKLDSESWIR